MEPLRLTDKQKKLRDQYRELYDRVIHHENEMTYDAANKLYKKGRALQLKLINSLTPDQLPAAKKEFSITRQDLSKNPKLLEVFDNLYYTHRPRGCSRLYKSQCNTDPFCYWVVGRGCRVKQTNEKYIPRVSKKQMRQHPQVIRENISPLNAVLLQKSEDLREGYKQMKVEDLKNLIRTYKRQGLITNPKNQLVSGNKAELVNRLVSINRDLRNLSR